ncbi:MAG: hypothetical protein RLP44_07755 [Aggregatilineales bacterium]
MLNQQANSNHTIAWSIDEIIETAVNILERDSAQTTRAIVPALVNLSALREQIKNELRQNFSMRSTMPAPLYVRNFIRRLMHSKLRARSAYPRHSECRPAGKILNIQQNFIVNRC